jgi:hypothetical protein
MCLDELLPFYELDVHGLLSRRNSAGSKICFVNFPAWNPKKFNVEFLIRAFCMTLETACSEPDTQVAGIVAVVNAEKFTFEMFYAMCSLSLISTFIRMIIAFPLRVKAVHIVNNFSLASSLYKLVKPFVPGKLQERVFLHGSDFESLHKVIDPELLPEEVKGNLGKFDNKYFIRLVRENAPAVFKMNEYGYIKKSRESGYRSD